METNFQNPGIISCVCGASGQHSYLYGSDRDMFPRLRTMDPAAYRLDPDLIKCSLVLATFSNRCSPDRSVILSKLSDMLHERSRLCEENNIRRGELFNISVSKGPDYSRITI